jgi:hypothetical protein
MMSDALYQLIENAIELKNYRSSPDRSENPLETKAYFFLGL